MTATLMLLHGFTGSGADWEALVPTLSAGYEVITPDIVGHGNAPKPDDLPRYTMDAAAEQLLSLTDEPLHLLGYSMGGRLALYMAVNYPQRVESLVLESASPGLKTQAERDARKERDDALADQIEANGISWFVEYWETLSLWDSQSPAQKISLHANRLQNDPTGLANSLRGMGTGAMPSLWDDLGTLTMPVLMMAGALDEKFTTISREMATRIPDAQLQIVPDAGHTIHLERPADFLHRVQAFLQGR